MSQKYLVNDDGSFLITNYNQAPTFSNFLPGIAGIWGIPLWVFYVNRAQGIVSFGLSDKDHAIAEFFSANKAYSFVSSLGFRTFLKINKEIFYEPFKSEPGDKKKQEMLIKSASLQIQEINPQHGLRISVHYFTLPNTSIPGLVRVVSLKNISKASFNLEVLDGLTRIIPFGATNAFLKNMSRTLEAWMQASYQDNLAIFRLIVDPRDVSYTRYIEGANFNYSFYQDKTKKIFPDIIIDPQTIFAHETSYTLPLNFMRKDFKASCSSLSFGKTPCAFSYFNCRLLPNQERILYNVFGATFKLDSIQKFINRMDAPFLKKKERENEQIIESVKKRAFSVSALKHFDYYIGSTYLDNVLRGGYPWCGNSHKVYYIFSRKHGDLERDYNNFQLLPSYFSEGEGNYRDISQNRRMDLFFEPQVKDKNIIYFLNFTKIDGYNPLVLKGEKLYFRRAAAQAILKDFGLKNQRLLYLMLRGFYLGEFFTLLEEEKIKLEKREFLASVLLEKAQTQPQASHSEGYWVDHWHYNLDLIENFLYFYPDERQNLFLKKEFVFWDDEYRIKPRSLRYVLRGGKVYQGESIEVVREKRLAIRRRKAFKNFLRTKEGKIYKTDLICKLLTLILNKATTLDPEGIGIEMEADKPGWCDSLNGLPALLGSSLSETLELKRAALILKKTVRELKARGRVNTTLPQEVFTFFQRTNQLLVNFLSSNPKSRNYYWWDKANSIKEDFRQKTFFYLNGREKRLDFETLGHFLKNLIVKLNQGIKKAQDKKSKLPFTYFTYNIIKYEQKNKHIVPLAFSKKTLPLFLEGVMHTLRVEGTKQLHQNLNKSELFDKKLKMYRLNTSLSKEPLEIGRSRAFAQGWLENESIWLHMEYKYLLELLKNGLYQEFFSSFFNCGVCFFNPAKYGRNIFENSSFIVSSAYLDRKLWGRGFVARLSGATAELLNIWILLCLGKSPFFLDKHKGLCLTFSPVLKKEFFTTKKETIYINSKKSIFPKNTFSFRLFSKTLVSYHNPKRKDTFSKDCRIKKIIVTLGKRRIILSTNIIQSPLSEAIRQGQASQIDIYLT